jgi:hypothetical protein
MGPRPVSISGTASDYLLGFLMSFIAPFLELVSYFINILCRRHSSKINYFIEVMCVCFSFPLIYPLYVLALLRRVIGMKAVRVSLETDRYDRVRPFVEFDREPCSLVTSKDVEESTDCIIVKLLRIEKLANCTDSGNPIVKFRVGRMETVSGMSLYGGASPQYNGKEVVFPLRTDLKLEDCNFSLEVVHKDNTTGAEVFITRYAPLNKTEFRKWIGDGRYEGFLELEDKSKLFLSLKVLDTVHGTSNRRSC